MTTCPHLQNGRCQLAERVALVQLGLQLDCVTNDEQCAKCQDAGGPSEEKPPLECLVTAARAVPRARKLEWSRFVHALHWRGSTTATASRLRSAGRSPARKPAPTCLHRGEKLQQFPCGCLAGGRRQLYACGVGGKCCLEETDVERAVEFLRREFPADRTERQVRACQNCPQKTLFVPLELCGESRPPTIDPPEDS